MCTHQAFGHEIRLGQNPPHQPLGVQVGRHVVAQTVGVLMAGVLGCAGGWPCPEGRGPYLEGMGHCVEGGGEPKAAMMVSNGSRHSGGRKIHKVFCGQFFSKDAEQISI